MEEGYGKSRWGVYCRLIDRHDTLNGAHVFPAAFDNISKYPLAPTQFES